ncbi:hypothetical protein [Brevibacillus sp. NRS-1366]|uniref:hypothetical protein n=1 Tax=Brevibacillus sp. NRS-1366 TaxID=3233899 RepID=UPI003D191F26
MTAFYKSMNTDRDANRREKWKRHREQTSDFIREVTDLISRKGSIAVFGAGNCDDLELELMTSNYDKVVLIDIDKEAVKQGISYLPEVDRQKIEIIETDLVNMSTFREEFSKKLEENLPKKKLSKYLRSIQLKNEEFHEAYKGAFDVTVIAAIQTQLFYNEAVFILSERGGYLTTDEIKDITLDLVYVRDQVIPSFISMVYDCTKDDGYMIQWTDIIEINHSNVAMLDEIEKLYTGKDRINYVNKMCNSYGIPAGVNSYKLFYKRINSEYGKFLMRYWRWPFADNKHYFVVGLYGQKGV